MDCSTFTLVFLTFLETFIVFQTIIYSPFYIGEKLGITNSSLNLSLGIFLASYPCGLIVGSPFLKSFAIKYGRKKCLLLNAISAILSLLVLAFAGNLYAYIFGFFLLGALGCTWNNIFGCIHDITHSVLAVSDIARENDTNNTLIITNKHKFLFYLELSHGVGCIMAGFVGVFIATLDNWASVETGTQTDRHSISTPFIISIILYFFALLMIYLLLDLKIDKTALNTSIVTTYYNSLAKTNHNLNGIIYSPISDNNNNNNSKLIKYNIESSENSTFPDSPNTREIKGLLASENSNHVKSPQTPQMQQEEEERRQQQQQEEQQNEPLLPLTEENLQNSQEYQRNMESFSPSPVRQRSASPNRERHPLMTPDSADSKTFLAYYALMGASGKPASVGSDAHDANQLESTAFDFHGNGNNNNNHMIGNGNNNKGVVSNVSLLEHSHDIINSMFDSISEIIQVYMKSRSFLILWFIAITFFVLIFSFDVLFPVFSSIPAVNGGMGWNAHYIGLFYVLYSATWIFSIVYRWWKLSDGYHVTSTYSHDSTRSLSLFSVLIGLVYGVVFPWCINSPNVKHAEWAPQSWMLVGLLFALILGHLSATIPFHIAQLFRDWRYSACNELISSTTDDNMLIDDITIIENNNNMDNDTNHNNNNDDTTTTTNATASKNETNTTNNNSNTQRDEDRIKQKKLAKAELHVKSKMSIHIVLANSIVYSRICAPIMVQLLYVLGLHFNSQLINGNSHSKHEWFQIGNFVFYFLSFLSFSILFFLQYYDSIRKEYLGQDFEIQQMSRLIEEVRRERIPMHMPPVIEDEDGLGFWLSLSQRSLLAGNTKHKICDCSMVSSCAKICQNKQPYQEIGDLMTPRY